MATTRLNQIFKLGVMAMGLASAISANALDASKPLKIIVPFNAGGGVDTVARIMADKLRVNLKQDVIVENKPGGSGMIGAMAVVKADPDGNTVLLGSAGETAINEFVFKGKMQYSPTNDLAPVTMVARIPNVLVAGAKLPVSSVADLIQYAKAHPGKVKFASSGIGNVQHLNGELLADLAGVKMVHVPYKGASKQLVDVASGDVEITFVSYAAARGFIADKKVKPLAVTSAKRADFDATIPTISETAGLKKYQLDNWFGMFAPAKTSEAVLEQLNKAAVAALKDAEISEKLKNMGGKPDPMSVQQFREFLVQERKQLADIVKQAEITVE